MGTAPRITRHDKADEVGRIVTLLLLSHVSADFVADLADELHRRFPCPSARSLMARHCPALRLPNVQASSTEEEYRDPDIR